MSRSLHMGVGATFRIFFPLTTLMSLVMMLLLLPFFVCAREFEVGGEDGWVVPESRDDTFYNHWAAKNRFRIGDTVRFKYERDSVMVVTGEEYDDCKSLQPGFYSNSGDTVITLDRSGLFYFISGVTGHCQKGQKLIIKVLSIITSDGPTVSPPSNRTTDMISSPPAPAESSLATTTITRNRVVCVIFWFLFRVFVQALG